MMMIAKIRLIAIKIEMMVIAHNDDDSWLFQDRPVNHIVSHAEFNPRNLGKDK